MKTNIWTWIALLAMTAASFIAHGSLHPQRAITLILAVAGMKCSALGWTFMDLRLAHWFWRAAPLILVVALLLVVRAVTASP